MALDDYVSVLILLTDYVQDSRHYPVFQRGLEEVSPEGKLPVYAAYGVNTVVTAHLPPPIIDILQGHTLVRKIYDGPVPARDYERINTRLHCKLQEWDVRFFEAARAMKL